MSIQPLQRTRGASRHSKEQVAPAPRAAELVVPGGSAGPKCAGEAGRLEKVLAALSGWNTLEAVGGRRGDCSSIVEARGGAVQFNRILCRMLRPQPRG